MIDMPSYNAQHKYPSEMSETQCPNTNKHLTGSGKPECPISETGVSGFELGSNRSGKSDVSDISIGLQRACHPPLIGQVR